MDFLLVFFWVVIHHPIMRKLISYQFSTFSFIFLQFFDKLNSINVWVLFICLQRLNFTLYVQKFFFILFFPNNKIKHITACLLLRFNTYIKCKAWWLTIGIFECMNNVMIFVVVMHVCHGMAWHGKFSIKKATSFRLLSI